MRGGVDICIILGEHNLLCCCYFCFDCKMQVATTVIWQVCMGVVSKRAILDRRLPSDNKSGLCVFA